MRVAIIEDDNDQAQVLNILLTEAGFDCIIFNSGQQAIRAMAAENFDLVLIDWLLPDISGIEVLDWVRAHQGWSMPVVFVTQKDEEADVVFALEHGADDYIAKPVKSQELKARIRALVRRVQPLRPVRPVLEFGPYRFNMDRRELLFRDAPVILTQKEFDLAVFLFRNAGRLLTRAHLLESVWGHSEDLNTRTLDTHISRLRKKLDLTPQNGWRLSAVYQHGYRLEPVGEGAESVA